MSSSNYYNLYIQKVLELAQTLVIKSEVTARAQNRFVTDYFGAAALDEGDLTSWKYYKNLAGEYHPTDINMTVVSMDTLEEITFSRQNLLIHRSTARHYQWGTRQYKELVSKYPTQERLILGILYPVDKAAAIAARDGQILGYPPGLVEENEYSLVPKLQTFIDRWRGRWFISGFTVSDELYAATALGVMYLMLVPAIITLRLEACKTNEAHSFHIRQYLGSHGFLDKYVDAMTRSQALFFYRNIAYIERNAGKREVFDWLVEHIMTERRFPIAEYTMRHDLTHQPEEVYPTLSFRRRQLNLDYAAYVTGTVSLPEVLFKERELARDNRVYEEDYEPTIRTRMENSRSNVVLTKLLESSLVDYSNSNPHTLTEVLMNEWLNQAGAGTYAAYVTINNPRTAELIALTAKEAFIFAWYAFCKSIGITLLTIPQVVASHVQRNPMATVDDLLSLVDTSLVSRELAQKALSMQPEIGSVVSTDAFYDLCYEIYQAGQFQRGLIAYQQHHRRRAMVQAMCERIYSDNVVTLAPEGTTYASWFAQHNLKIEEISPSELALLYYGVVQDVTGLALHQTTSLKDLQRAMVQMLGQLSSYSIQITSEINDADIKRTDWTVVRVGDVGGKSKSHWRDPDAIVGVTDVSGKGKTLLDVPISLPHPHKLIDARSKLSWEHEIRSAPDLVIKERISPSFMRVAQVRASYHDQPADNDEGIIPVLGYEDSYINLNQQQRQSLRDVYNTPYLSEPIIPGDLSQQVGNTLLDGLIYIPANSLLDENGLPFLDETGDYLLGG
jgi:hypothetical protein